MNDEDDFVRITLRIPKALHGALTESAAKKKSMNAEIIDRLEASFEAEKAELSRKSIDAIIEALAERFGPPESLFGLRSGKPGLDSDEK